MCTSSKDIHLQKSILPINHSPIKKSGLRKFWIYRIKSGHLFSIIRISPNKRLNISLLIFHNSDNKCHICFMNRSFCNLELKRMHCLVILSDNNQSTCILIETMNDSRTLYPIDNRWIFRLCHRERSDSGVWRSRNFKGKFIIFFWIASFLAMTEIFFIISRSKSLKVIQQCIYECSHPSSFSRSWMCIDSCILIDDRKIIILIDNIEWHILCNKCHLIYLPLYLYNISSIDFFILSKMSSVTRYLPFFDHLLKVAS